MWHRTQLIAMGVAGLLSVGAGVALAAGAGATSPEGTKAKAEQTTTQAKEKETAADRTLRGEVTAVDTMATPHMVTVQIRQHAKTESMAIEVPDTAKILEGKMDKSLADVTVGSHVWVKYDQMSGKHVADAIHILKPKMSKMEKEAAADRTLRGEVTAVDTAVSPHMVTVKIRRHAKTESMAIEVPDTAKILEGKMDKSLTDVTVGSYVWVKYDQMSGKHVADAIHILKPKMSKEQKVS